MRLFDMSFEWGSSRGDDGDDLEFPSQQPADLPRPAPQRLCLPVRPGDVLHRLLVGTVASVGVGSWVYGHHPVAWIAALAGALLSAVFNYAASSVFTWRK